MLSRCHARQEVIETRKINGRYEFLLLDRVIARRGTRGIDICRSAICLARLRYFQSKCHASRTDGKFLGSEPTNHGFDEPLSFSPAESCFNVREPCLSVVDHRADS